MIVLYVGSFAFGASLVWLCVGSWVMQQRNDNHRREDELIKLQHEAIEMKETYEKAMRSLPVDGCVHRRLS
jgi:hypothetical protein